jgi:hypothetical protein
MLPGRSKRLGKRQAAAERVAVRVLVPEDQDLIVGVDELFDLVVEISTFALRGGYGSTS